MYGVKVSKPGKPSSPQTPLSRDRIGEAALALIDREGLPAFSARRLASELGREAMSLYHHAENMDDVLDLVVDRLMAELAVRPTRDGHPGKVLLAEASRFLDLAEAHPHAFVLVATRRWRTPNALAAAEVSITLFRELGAAPRDALRRARILGAYLGGAGIALAAWAKDSDAILAAAPLGAARAMSAGAVRADLVAGLKRLLIALGA